MMQLTRRVRVQVEIAALLLIAGCGGSGPSGSDSRSASLGDALNGTSSVERSSFEEGRLAFMEIEGPDDGIGPVFNGVSCAECHAAGAVGGAGLDLTISRVTRIGGVKNGQYSDLAEFGGPLLQARSVRELITSYPVAPEVVPSEAIYVSHRITTPLFGAGLIEAIADETIRANANTPQPDGVHGVVHHVTNPLNGRTEVGRFGWKARVSTLDAFAFDAYLNEMGITTPVFPNENLPQGQSIPSGLDHVGDPEDDGADAVLFAEYMRFLAAPKPEGPVTALTTEGEKLFAQIKCTSCHLPSMRTGPNASEALRNKMVILYSDLLLHRMGSGLDDGVRQGQAASDQWRTAPLWGLSKRQFFLHDGRATTVAEAVMAHGGEAQAARNRFASLSVDQQGAVVAFLKQL